MKMTSPRMTFASLLGIAFLTIGAAAAQTAYYYSNGSSATVPGGAINGGSLASIGFDSYQTNNVNAVMADGGAISTASDGFGTLFYSNFVASGLATTLGDGSILESVTLQLFAQDLSPDTLTTQFEIYGGLNATGGQVGSFSLSDPANQSQFFSLTVSAATFAGGFSIGTFGDALNQFGLLNVNTEEYLTDLGRTPMLIANYSPVPEPSAALLGALGALGLMRRRRA